MKKAVGLALALLLGLTQGAFAQVSTGNIYGTVTDASGAVLPGATLTLAGATGTRSTTAGAQGDFRFLNVDHGNFKLTVTLTGFTTVTRDVIVTTGRSLSLAFGLRVAPVEETVTVTAETPVVDTKKQGTSHTYTRDELSQVPSGRDPWVVLRATPGITVDRVNIAGNESGQQAAFTGKGAAGADAMWSLDGVMITDMAAVGASPTYFDFDALDEITIMTGGNDLKVQTGGIGLNFVTKRGTNDFHGSARGFLAHDKLQSSNLTPELEVDPRLNNKASDIVSGAPVRRDKADHIQEVVDWGGDVGGPIMKDKLWFWGSYGRQDIRVQRLDGTRDRTVLKNFSGKINWQMDRSDSLSVFYFNGAKEKYGRSPGSGLLETDSFLRNQGGEYPAAFPRGLVKGELNHVFNPNFFINAKYAYYGTGFHLVPRGGTGCDAIYNYVTGVADGCSSAYYTMRPQHTLNIDGNYFTSAIGGNHEWKFGFAFRRATVKSTTAISGDGLVAVTNPGDIRAAVERNSVSSAAGKYWSVYLGDTFTKGRLTLNVGVRWDRQTGESLAVTAPANRVFPELLPALEFNGGGAGVHWSDLSPRAGITYALNESRKTVLRASFARYAGQLPNASPTYDSPLSGIADLEYGWRDLNGDGKIQKNEVDTSRVLAASNVDPQNPTLLGTINQIDPNFKANHDAEFIVGIDHELIPNLAAGVAYTYRKSTDFSFTPFIGLAFGGAAYVAQPAVTANGFTTQGYYTINAAAAAAVTGGRTLTNRPDYGRTFNGVEVNLNKRLSNKWMTRIGVALNSWVYNINSGAAFQDPNHTTAFSNFDGGNVMLTGTGSGKTVYYGLPKWTINASALYQLPWQIEVAGNLYAREGYPRPVYLRLSEGVLNGTANELGVPAVNTVTNPTLVNLDLRLAKNVKLGSASVALTADVFNVFNANTQLNRFPQSNSTAFNRLDEILNPRILRFGIRLLF